MSQLKGKHTVFSNSSIFSVPSQSSMGNFSKYLSNFCMFVFPKWHNMYNCQPCFTLTTAPLCMHNYTSLIFLLKSRKNMNKYVLTFFYHLIFRICLQIQSRLEWCWKNKINYFINTNLLRFCSSILTTPRSICFYTKQKENSMQETGDLW